MKKSSYSFLRLVLCSMFVARVIILPYPVARLLEERVTPVR